MRGTPVATGCEAGVGGSRALEPSAADPCLDGTPQTAEEVFGPGLDEALDPAVLAQTGLGEYVLAESELSHRDIAGGELAEAE